MRLAFMLLLAGGCGASGRGAPGAAEPAALAVEPGSGPRRIEVIAHRGASGERPENTMAAFRRAAELGADRVELDVMLSADGAVVVFHDETLERTTDGTGALRDHDLEELRALDAGSWFDAAYAGERIPTLDEVLEWSVGRMPLNVELKVEGDEAHAVRLARAAVEVIRRHEATGDTVISSFDHAATAEAARLASGCEVALLWNGRDDYDPLDRAAELGAGSLNLALEGMTPELVARARERGIPLRVYTVNDREALDRLVAAGPAAVFTDYPDRVLGWLGRAAGG